MLVRTGVKSHSITSTLFALHPFLKYVVAFLLIVITTLIQLNFLEWALKIPFFFYLITVFLCSRFLGWKPGLFAIIITSIVSVYFFLLPNGKFDITTSGIYLLIYLIECFIIAELCFQLNKTYTIFKTNEQSFVEIIENSAEGIAKIDTNGKILYVSPTVEKILGYTKEEFQVMPFIKYINETERPVIAEAFSNVIKEPGKTISVIHRLKNKSGEWLWVESSFTNLLQREGINSILSNFRDVTEKIDAERKKNDFLGIVAHEMKNPITNLNLNFQLIDLALESSNISMIRKFNSKCIEQLNRISKLIDDLLNISKFEASTLKLNYETIYVNEIIRECIQTFLAHYKNKVTVNGETNRYIKADKYRIEQVFSNLLSNAAKYSSEDKEIIIEVTEEKNELKFSVIDKGIGISPDKTHLLFKKFQRGERVNHTKGFGLGLYICYQIIKAHKGEMGVDSEENKGSAFWFTLPKIYHKSNF